MSEFEARMASAKAIAQELGLEEPEIDPDAALLARDFGMGGQMEPEERDLEIIEGEILFYKRQAGQSIIEIGKRLNEAKAQLGHGEWLPWLREKVDISERSAQDFMRLAREYSKSAEIADLGAAKALALLALPVSEREEFAAQKHTVDGVEKSVSEMTAKELKKAIEERDEAQKRAEELERELEDQLEEQRRVYDVDMADVQEKLEAAEDRADALKKELEELRAKPVEVAVEVDEAAVEKAAVAARAEADRQWKVKVKEAEKKLLDAEQEKGALEKQIGDLRKAAEAAAAKQGNAEQLAGEVEALKKQLAMSDARIVAFKAKFEGWQAAFAAMNAALQALDAADREKMAKAVLAQTEAWGKTLRPAE